MANISGPPAGTSSALDYGSPRASEQAVPQITKLALSQTVPLPDSRRPSPSSVLPVNMAPRLSSPRLFSTPRSPRSALPGVQEGNEESSQKAEEAAVLESETREHAHQTARMHQEAHATLKHMFQQAHGDDNILRHFIAFVSKDEAHWQAFWSRFRPDGTMTWLEFEKYIHWDQH